MSWKWIKRVGYTLLLLAGVYLVTFLILNAYWESEYRETVQKLKEEGIIRTKQILKRRYQKNNPKRDPMPAADGNGQTYPSNLPEVMEEDVKNGVMDVDLQNGSEEERREKAKGVLHKLKPYRDDLQRVFDHTFQPIEMPWEKLPVWKRDHNASPITHVQKRSNMAQILSSYGRAHLLLGEHEAAVKTVRKLYEIANAFFREPTFISLSVGFGISIRANELLLRLWKQNGPLPDDLREPPLPSASRLRSTLRYALQTELFLYAPPNGTDFISYVQEGYSAPWELHTRAFLWKTGTRSLKVREIFYSLFKQPYYQVHKEEQKIEKQLDTLWFPQNILPRSLSHNLHTNHKIVAHTIAHNQLTRFAIRFLTNPDVRGPDDLPGWNRAVDPFSGKPYKFRKKKGKIRLYSVGMNMKDDGGKEGAHREKGDIVVHIPVK